MKTKSIENIISDESDKSSGINYLNSLWKEASKNPNITGDSEALYSKYIETINPELYSADDVEAFTNSITSDQHGLGAFISASINKKTEDCMRLILSPKAPIDFLLYKFTDGMAKVDIAGDNFASFSKNSYVYAKKVGYNAFCSADGVYSKVGEATTWFGQYAKNSKFKVKSLGNMAFNFAENVKAKVGSAGAEFGSSSKDSYFKAKQLEKPYLSNTSGVKLKY